MGISDDDIKFYDTLTLKILPLIVLVILTIRVFDQFDDIPYFGEGVRSYLTSIDIESFVYGLIIFAVALTSLWEMNYARGKNYSSFINSLNAGAFIMFASFILGMILGTVALVTGYPTGSISSVEFITQLIPYYMVFGILILIVGARLEISKGLRLGQRIQQY